MDDLYKRTYDMMLARGIIVETPAITRALKRRLHPREDGLRPGMAQLSHGYMPGDYLHATREPQVRVDIQTAVHVAMAAHNAGSAVPLMVQLLEHSDPIEIRWHEWPRASVAMECAVEVIMRWSNRLRSKISAREVRTLHQTYSHTARVRARLEEVLFVLVLTITITSLI